MEPVYQTQPIYPCENCSAEFLTYAGLFSHSVTVHSFMNLMPPKITTTLNKSKRALSTDPILREILEEVITKSHGQWRSIPETAILVLRAVEDYKHAK